MCDNPALWRGRSRHDDCDRDEDGEVRSPSTTSIGFPKPRITPKQKNISASPQPHGHETNEQELLDTLQVYAVHHGRTECLVKAGGTR